MWADVQPGLRKRCCQNWEQPRWVQEAWISVRMVQAQSLTIALLAKQPRVCHAGCPLVQRALWTQTLFSHLLREGEKTHTKNPIQPKHLNWVSAQPKDEAWLRTEPQLSSPSPWVRNQNNTGLHKPQWQTAVSSVLTHLQSPCQESSSLQKWVIVFLHTILNNTQVILGCLGTALLTAFLFVTPTSPSSAVIKYFQCKKHFCLLTSTYVMHYRS